MLLVDVKTLPDEMERFDYWFRGILAVDPETQAHLKSSHGRSKMGRPHKYWVAAPDGTFHTGYFQRSVSQENPKGAEQVPWYRSIFHFSAWSDAEAIEKANKLYPRKFAAFQVALQQVREQEASHAS